MLIAVALSAAPAPQNREQISLATAGLRAVNLSSELQTFFTDHLAQQLTLQGFRVMTPSEISAIIGFEREKELLGCTDSSQTCMAELADALGVDALLVGGLAKFDNLYQINVKVIGSQNAKPIAAFSGQAEGERGLIEKLNEAARSLTPAVRRHFGVADLVAAVPPPSAAPPGPTVIASQPSGGRIWPMLPSIAGGVLLVGGGAIYGVSLGQASAIRDPAQTTSLEDARARAQTAQNVRVAGIGAMALGAASLAVAGVMYALSSSDAAPPVAMAPAITPDGAAMVLTGSF